MPDSQTGVLAVKRTILCIISSFVILAHTFALESMNNGTNDLADKAKVSIKFFDRTMYYPGNSSTNPVNIHVTVSNTGKDTLRFKLADDRKFSLDFDAYDVKNSQLKETSSLIEKRTTSQTVYFREIALEPGEEYSFVENLKDFLDINAASIYYIDLRFYPELYNNKESYLTSNRLSLEVRPSPAAASSSIIPVEVGTGTILQRDAISPDKVIEQTIIARQRSLWDQFFLYMDLEEILKRDPARSRRYNSESADGRNQMLASFRSDLQLDRIDRDIVALPSSFAIETTTYSQTDGSVKVLEYFDNGTFIEKKRYTYYVRQRDGIWQIYNYAVDNLGTE